MMNNIFSTRLRELISESEKSQKQISAELGINREKLSKWKMEYNEPNLDDLIMLALYFEVTIDFLLGLEDEFGVKQKP